MPIRTPAVAGSWYPAQPTVLAAEVDRLLAEAQRAPRFASVSAVIAPHAGLMYSGPVAAFAYAQLVDRDVDLVALVGPSHFVAFDGVALYDGAAFASPLGALAIDRGAVEQLLSETPVVHVDDGPHRREHSLEMQLPLLARVLPTARILPMLVGHQTRSTAEQLGDALARVLSGRRAVAVASTDLSHYHDARTAARLDAVVIDAIEHFDAEALQTALERNPHHACGGGPAVAVMRAARGLGARDARVLQYADSGDVSGDKTSVVGYVAAALGLA